MTKALIIGSDGMLGRAIVSELGSRGIITVAPSLAEFDLLDQGAGALITQEPFDWVINCAAWTDVDGAESNEAAATKINADGVAMLAAACKEAGSTLAHYSTDYVFRGDSSQPYRVDEPRSPVSAYGRSKAMGEVALESSGALFLLMRTSWLYAPWGKNFVLTMRSLMQSRDELRVVNDQRGRPTSAEQLARRTVDLLEGGHLGVFHLCDGGECTWWEFAKEIAGIVGAGTRVEPCASDEFPRPAERPAYSVLDLSAANALIGEPNHWQDELRGVLSRAETAI